MRNNWYGGLHWRAILTLTLFHASVGFAETRIDQRLLGVTEQGLKEAVAAVVKVPKPTLGPRGTRGIFSLPNARAYGEAYDTTFFFKAGRLTRIEQRRAASIDLCDSGYVSLITQMDLVYGRVGSSLLGAKTGEGNQSTVWVADRFKVVAYKFQNLSLCEFLVAFEPHEVRDASEL